MNKNDKVKIESLTNGIVNMYDPDLKLNIYWNQKGAIRFIPFEKLEEAVYNEGIAAMFKDGILGIAQDNALEILQELGLEDPDVSEPTNIIILTDAQRKRLLSTAPIGELKETIGKISFEQQHELADYAIENNLCDYDRCEIIKKAIGTDVITAIKLKKQNEEKIDDTSR